MIYQKDIFRMMEVVNKTCLNWETFRTRQEIYLNSFSRQENSIKNNHQSSETVLALEKENKSQFFRVVKSKTEVYDIITKAFYRREGWRELPHGLNLGPTWSLLWTWGKINMDYGKLLIFQKMNHFINIKRMLD